MGMLIHRHNERNPEPNVTTSDSLSNYEPEESYVEPEQEQDERRRRGRPPKNDDM